MTESQMQSASTTHDAKPGSVFAGVQPAQRVESTMRMYFLDAALRLKLRSLLWAGLPVTLDAWRQSHDMDAVVASGIWPFISYVDLEVYDVQLAGGRMAELRSAIRAGRTAQDGRSDGPIVLATEVSIYAQLGGGKASDFMQTAADGRELAGRMRVITNLVRPMAAPDERAVRILPPQLTGVDVAPCAPAPSSSELLQRPVDAAQRAQLETRGTWAQHHTDANQIVFTGEYLACAEDACGTLAQQAGLRPAGVRMARGQLVLKRPFLAGMEYWVRGQLVGAPGATTLVALISFHGAAAPGVADDRPSVVVRIDVASS